MILPVLSPRNSQYLLATQLAILILAFASRNPTAWLLASGAVAIISLFAWISSIWETKVIADTPVLTIASAAQGYVELKGIPSTKPEYILVAKSGLPCVWFRCVTYHKSFGKDWQEIESVCSDSIFELNDSGGVPCMVDPEHAKIITSNRRTWYHDDYRHVEEQLFPGQPLYLLGEFSTLAADTAEADFETDVSRLLAEWKKDKVQLLKRFDSNGDGKIDMAEWEQARKAAYQEVGRQSRRLSEQPGIHILSRPKNGKLFLISNLSEHALRQTSTFWAWVHLLMFFGNLSGIFWLVLKNGFLHGRM